MSKNKVSKLQEAKKINSNNYNGNVITIEIKNIDKLFAAHKVENSKTPQEEKNEKMNPEKHNITENVFRNIVSNTVQNTALATGQIIAEIAENSINKYFQLSDDYISANYISNIKTNYSNIKSIARNSLIAYNSSGGGATGAAAAVVTAGITFVKQYVEYQKKMTEYKTALNATNIETEFRQQRAELYNGGRGTEN